MGSCDQSAGSHYAPARANGGARRYSAVTTNASMYGEIPASRVRGVLDVTSALQRATTSREIQSAFLAAIPMAVPAGGHGFYVLDPSDRRPINVAATVPDSFLQRYEDEGRRDDPVLEEAMVSMAPIDSSRLPEERSWDASAVLTVLERAGFYHSLEAPVVVEGAVHATLNMARRRDAQPFSSHDLTVMGCVANQVGAALTRAQRFEQITREALLLADALDASSQPIVITTVDGELIFRNRMATRPVPGSSTSYLERAQPLLTEALDELRNGVNRIVTALEQLVVPSPGHEARGTSAGRSGTTGRLPDSGLVALKAVRLRSRHNAVVSFLSHRRGNMPGLPEGAIPLSPRERGIADLVSQGLTNRQIAELSYVSENTVKQHLKRIFTKLEVNSRAELVQAVWQASTSRPDHGQDPDPDPDPDPSQ